MYFDDCKSVKHFRERIDELLGPPHGASETVNLPVAYSEALQRIRAFRDVYDRLPDAPFPRDNPRAGLAECAEWFRSSEKIAEQIPATMEPEVVQRYIDLLMKLRGLPVGHRFGNHEYTLPDAMLDSAQALERDQAAIAENAPKASAQRDHFANEDPGYNRAHATFWEATEDVLEEILQLNKTATGKLFVAYDSLLRGGEIQEKIDALGRHYDPDTIAEYVLLDGESESHCTLVDGIVAAFRVFQQKATSAEDAAPEPVVEPKAGASSAGEKL